MYQKRITVGMQKSPFYLLFSPDTKNEFPGNIEAPSLRLLRTPVASSPSSSTSSLFAITAHPWRRRPRRRGSSQLPTRHITRTATARRRRYVCSAHQWPFRHHRTPVATAPSPSRPFQAHSNSNLDLIVNSVIPPTCDCVIPVNIVQLIAKLFL